MSQSKICKMIRFQTSINACIVLLFYSVSVHAQQALHAGETAPKFQTIDYKGYKVELDSFLKRGPVIVLFYTGEWCEYSNKQLTELQDSLKLIRDKGASVIAVTPETPESVLQTINKTKAQFTIVSDKDHKIMRDYNVAFKLNAVAQKKYKSRGIDLEKSTGNTEYILPVPAVYIINPDGILTYVFFNTDYTQRPSVKTLLTNL